MRKGGDRPRTPDGHVSEYVLLFNANDELAIRRGQREGADFKMYNPEEEENAEPQGEKGGTWNGSRTW